jgi:hypothetical protein
MVAVFTHNFIYLCPLSRELPPAAYSSPFEVSQRAYTNAVVAFEISIASLQGATMGEKQLSERIDLSRHQHRDLMIAFCQVEQLREGYTRLIAIIYETLAYEFNDDIRYPADAPLNPHG